MAIGVVRAGVGSRCAGILTRLAAFLAEDRGGAVVGPEDMERLGPLALGVLNGEARWGARTGAPARLVAAGRLHRMPQDTPGQGCWESRDAPPSDADEFERELWDTARPLHVRDPAFSPGQGEGEYLWELRAPNSYHLVKSAEARLLGEGWTRAQFEMVPGQPLRRGRWSAIAAAVSVPAVTVLLLDQAWVRAGLAFLIGAMALRKVFPDGPAVPRHLPTVTGKGGSGAPGGAGALRGAGSGDPPGVGAVRPGPGADGGRALRLRGARPHRRQIMTDWSRPAPEFVDGPGE